MVNDESLLADVGEQDRAKEVKELTSEIHSKALGIQWDVYGDYFNYINRPVADGTKVTRRIILSQVSTMYDSLELIAPIIQQGKMIFQEVTRLRLQWDDPVPPHLEHKWYAWLASLCDLKKLQFNRCLVPDGFVDGAAELVHFYDASQAGYGACSNIGVVNKSAEIHVALIMSKGRLSPLKQITIPRLELCAISLSGEIRCSPQERAGYPLGAILIFFLQTVRLYLAISEMTAGDKRCSWPIECLRYQ